MASFPLQAGENFCILLRAYILGFLLFISSGFLQLHYQLLCFAAITVSQSHHHHFITVIPANLSSHNVFLCRLLRETYEPELLSASSHLHATGNSSVIEVIAIQVNAYW